jgi:hypothetical protein
MQIRKEKAKMSQARKMTARHGTEMDREQVMRDLEERACAARRGPIVAHDSDAHHWSDSGERSWISDISLAVTQYTEERTAKLGAIIVRLQEFYCALDARTMDRRNRRIDKLIETWEFLTNLRRTAVFMCAFLILFVMPVYALVSTGRHRYCIVTSLDALSSYKSNSTSISATIFTIPSLTHLDQYGYVTSAAYMRGTGAAVALIVIWALSSAALLYGDSHKEHTEATVAKWNLLGHWNSAMTRQMQVMWCVTRTRCFQYLVMKTTFSGIGTMAFDETIYRAIIAPFYSRVCDCYSQSPQWPPLTPFISTLYCRRHPNAERPQAVGTATKEIPGRQLDVPILHHCRSAAPIYAGYKTHTHHGSHCGKCTRHFFFLCLRVSVAGA